jgi:hypothetical protein
MTKARFALVACFAACSGPGPARESRDRPAEASIEEPRSVAPRARRVSPVGALEPLWIRVASAERDSFGVLELAAYGRSVGISGSDGSTRSRARSCGSG